MRFHAEQRFSVPSDRLLALFTDADFYSTLTGLPKISVPEIVDHSASGDTVRISMRQRYTGDLPSAALAFIDPARLTWVEELVFDLSERRATTRLLPDHYPDRLTCSGVYVFADSDGGSTRRLEGELKVRAPLVGGRVEQALVSGLQEHAAAEQQLIESRLTTQLRAADRSLLLLALVLHGRELAEVDRDEQALGLGAQPLGAVGLGRVEPAVGEDLAALDRGELASHDQVAAQRRWGAVVHREPRRHARCARQRLGGAEQLVEGAGDVAAVHAAGRSLVGRPEADLALEVAVDLLRG